MLNKFFCFIFKTPAKKDFFLSPSFTNFKFEAKREEEGKRTRKKLRALFLESMKEVYIIQ
jgi:hypothetical protein